jgi:hypothetical protein
MKTAVPNTAEQTFDAVNIDHDAEPSSEAEMEKRLSMIPATKSIIETMRS